MKFCKLLRFFNPSRRSPYQCTGFYMIKTSVMKKLTTLNNEFTESEMKRINSHVDVILISHVYISIYLWVSQRFEKPFWLINTRFCDIRDMFFKYRSRSSKVVCKIGVLESFAKFSKKHLYRSLLLKSSRLLDD